MSDLLHGKAAVAHLLRRAAFGPQAETWASWRDLSFDEALERLLAGLDEKRPDDPPGFDAYVPGAIQQVWLDRMHRGAAPLAEKLALFWHGHFATSNAKIQDPQLMWTQYGLFRDTGAASFADLLSAVGRDVAMIRWLDGNANRKGHANENYAREVQELFTLGRGNYTEQDIREIARAFTGWGSRHHDFVFREQFHDTGDKTIHGETGAFDGDDVVRLLTGLPVCATFLAGKLLRFFSHPKPTTEEVENLATVMRASDLHIGKTLEALFRDPAFRDPARQRALVRGPVDFVIAAVRAAGLDEVPTYVHASLDRCGQILFRPPSVKGWPSGTGWLSSGAVVERLRLAQRIAGQAKEDAIAAIVETAFEGDIPDGLGAAVESTQGKDRVALVLGCPEFQMA